MYSFTDWRGYGEWNFAGLQSIDTDVYEAADLDGATGFKRFSKITFPLLPVLIVYIFCQKWIMNGVLPVRLNKENKYKISGGQPENEEELVERKYCISNLSKKL